MLHLFLPRCAGKTSRLIAKAYAEGCDILVATRRMGDCVIDTAKHMGIPGKINRDPRRGPPSIGDVRVLIPADLRERAGDHRHDSRPILIDDIDLSRGRHDDPAAGRRGDRTKTWERMRRGRWCRSMSITRT